MYRRVMMCQSSEGRITNYNPDRETKRKGQVRRDRRNNDVYQLGYENGGV